MKVETIDELRALLGALREFGVTDYESTAFSLRLKGSQPSTESKPVEDDDPESWAAIERRLIERDEAEQFAHVSGGRPRGNSS